MVFVNASGPVRVDNSRLVALYPHGMYSFLIINRWCMRLTKTKVERWVRNYSKFASACCWWGPVCIAVLVLGFLFSSSDSSASKIAGGLMGVAAGFLFVVMGGYSALVGLSLFYQRWKTSKLGAVCGLCAGMVFGALVASLGIIGFLMMLR